MKKTAAVLLSATVVLVGILLSAIFSLGSSEQPLELAPKSFMGLTDLTPATLKADSGITQPDGAKFETFNFATAGATRTFTGKIISTTTGNGIQNEVAIICNEVVVGTGSSDASGNFKILVNRDDCLSGAMAHAQTTYVEQTFNSSQVSMPNTPTFGRSAQKSLRQDSLSSQLSQTAEVPEFSTITLGIAAMVSCLGILYLRKQ